jgi:regulator of protease activity HflC (stomatin/prohibitin superfamily)
MINPKKITLISVLSFFFFITVTKSCYTVDPGEYAIHVRLGTITGIQAAGFHGKIPFIDTIISMNVKIIKHSTESEASSKDMQSIRTTIAVNYKLIDEKVGEIYRTIGIQEMIEPNLIDPAVQETFKAITAKYTAEELILYRDKISDEIKKNLAERLFKYHLDIKEINITNFDFSVEFAKAIEQKLIAQQNALKASNDLNRIKVEAEQKIVEAKGEAQALQLKKTTLSQDLLLLEAIKRWDGKLPQVVGNGTPLLNLK